MRVQPALRAKYTSITKIYSISESCIHTFFCFWLSLGIELCEHQKQYNFEVDVFPKKFVFFNQIDMIQANMMMEFVNCDCCGLDMTRLYTIKF